MTDIIEQMTGVQEKRRALAAIIAAIDKNLVARSQEQHDAALAEFESALDYYLARQAQAWVR